MVTSAFVFIYYFPLFEICLLYCYIHFVFSLYIVCSLYIWPLLLIYIFACFLYFRYSCIVIYSLCAVCIFGHWCCCIYLLLSYILWSPAPQFAVNIGVSLITNTLSNTTETNATGGHILEKNIFTIFEQPTFYDEYPKLRNSEDYIILFRLTIT